MSLPRHWIFSAQGSAIGKDLDIGRGYGNMARTCLRFAAKLGVPFTNTSVDVRYFTS
jgi:hypothetical protein